MRERAPFDRRPEITSLWRFKKHGSQPHESERLPAIWCQYGALMPQFYLAPFPSYYRLFVLFAGNEVMWISPLDGVYIAWQMQILKNPAPVFLCHRQCCRVRVLDGHGIRTNGCDAVTEIEMTSLTMSWTPALCIAYVTQVPHARVTDAVVTRQNWCGYKMRKNDAKAAVADKLIRRANVDLMRSLDVWPFLGRLYSRSCTLRYRIIYISMFQLCSRSTSMADVKQDTTVQTIRRGKLRSASFRRARFEFQSTKKGCQVVGNISTI